MSAAGSFVLYSDGGGRTGGTAAGACILEQASSGKREHLAVYLGKATNNEAEISAGLLGFSYLKFAALCGRPVSSVRWVCDSEYVLKGATEYIFSWQKNGWKTSAKEPVKNQGLWGVYLRLSENLKISPEHVRGHTGHSENELCDEAVGWARTDGIEILSERGEGRYPMQGEKVKWLLLDGQEFLSELRKVEPGGVADWGAYASSIDYFVSKFQAIAGSKKRVSKAKEISLKPVFDLLEHANREALLSGAQGEELARGIRELLARFKS
jgi:ribonuclease HI